MSAVNDFVAWALSSARTLDERCAIEQVMERGADLWRIQRQIPSGHHWKYDYERQKARRLNPAYEPTLDATHLERAVEALQTQTIWRGGFSEDRPIRSVTWLPFFPQFEEVSLDNCEVPDYSPLAAMPRLKTLGIQDHQTLDVRQLSECAGLEDLRLSLRQPWVKVEGLERLERLRAVQWSGAPHSLQAIPRWPKVRRAILRDHANQLPLRDATQLPEMPCLELLELAPIFSLEGLERYPRLENLRVAGPYRDVHPLAACRALTHLWLELPLHLDLDWLQDLRPLATLPELRFLVVISKRPRDYSCLAEAPRLHQVRLMGGFLEPVSPCAMEIATLNAALEPWDSEFLAPHPRPLPPLQVHWTDSPNLVKLPADEQPPDWDDNPGYRESEGQWVQQRLAKRLGQLLQDNHWGNVAYNHYYLSFARNVVVTIQSQEAAERLSEVIESIRTELATLRCHWSAALMVSLELPPVLDPKELANLRHKDYLDDDGEFERRQKEEADYLDRLHRFELLKETGAKIRPEDFAAPEAVQEKPESEGSDTDVAEADDELGGLLESDRPHPLADQYSLYGTIHEGGAFFSEHRRSTVLWLLGRQQ